MLTCQWDDGQSAFPKPLVDRVVKKLTRWEKEVLKCREIEPIPRALGLIQWQPT
jgi:hypothetical protein